MELNSRPPNLGYAGLFCVQGAFVPEVSLRQSELRWWLTEFFRGEGFSETVKHDPLPPWLDLLGHTDN